MRNTIKSKTVSKIYTLLMSLCLLVLFVPFSFAQTPITSIQATYDNVTDASNNYTAGGNNYIFNFGNQNNLLIQSVDAGGRTYLPALLANRIRLERVNITGIPNGREIMFYEGSISDNNIRINPGFKNTMQEVLLSPVLNRGVDNIFQNTGDGSGNVNNVVRVDFVFDDGILIPNTFNEQGFIIKERGGNDPIKIAAILSIDGSGAPTSFGPVVSAVPADWGPSGFTMITHVLRRDAPTDPYIRSTTVGSQPITGILFTFQQLGLSPGQTIYGYALASGGAPNNSANWLNTANFATNTTAANGGLDLLAGGSYFSSNPVIIAEDDSFTTPFETTLNATVTANDTFTPGSQFEKTSNPSNGSVVFNSDGSFSYTPNSGYSGTDTFNYKVCLPAPLNYICDTATVTITIDAPAGPVINLFPATGFGTLAFEDLWPSKGDYDFNDLVVDYQFEITSNHNNFVEQVKATFVLRAFGAGYQNGFGFQLGSAINQSSISVSGYSITENYITLNGNGTEAGQNRATIIVFDNAYNEMQHPGVGIGVNTETAAPYVQPKTFTILIDFPANTYTFSDLNIGNFNPFLIANLERGREVHLPGYPPTSLANPAYFGTEDDATNLSQGRTYVTSNNLPWAINIYEKFDYPIELQDIIWVHLKFVEWAESGGVLFPDWYKNLPGYRNQALIYKKP
jgi:LruC domain-containing protein